MLDDVFLGTDVFFQYEGFKLKLFYIGYFDIFCM